MIPGFSNLFAGASGGFDFSASSSADTGDKVLGGLTFGGSGQLTTMHVGAALVAGVVVGAVIVAFAK